MCTGVLAHDYICRGQLLILVSSFTIFHVILRQNLLLNLETAWPLSPRDCLFHGSTAKPSSCIGSGDVNPDPHACTVSTLPTEAAPSPKSLLIIISKSCIFWVLKKIDLSSIFVVFWIEFPCLFKTLGEALTYLSGATHWMLPFSVGLHHPADQSLLGFYADTKHLPRTT